MTLIEWFVAFMFALAIICAFGMIHMIGGIYATIIAICFVYFVYRFTKLDRK